MPAVHDQEDSIQMRKDAAIFTLSFTEAERRRIDRAASIYDWKSDESALFARQLLLGNVAEILRPRKPSQPGTLMRSRLRSLLP
jgi:hypothetical protein